MRNSAIARLVVMGGLTIGLLVPLLWVRGIVAERAARRNGAVAEVSATWGAAQVIGGPVLSVPYTYSWLDNAGHQQRGTSQARFLPEQLQIEGTVATDARRRGIFDVIVYRANLKLHGTFVRPELDSLKPSPERVEWDRATVQIGVSDPRGLRSRAALTWQGRTLPLAGAATDAGLFRTGLRTSIPSLADTVTGTAIPFDVTLDLNGTRDLQFLPSAGEAAVSLTSPWPHPSFVGAVLPETRQIQSNGFTATWRVQEFGRAYPARWTSTDVNGEQFAAAAAQSAFGVTLVQPVDIYQQAERAVKYAVLFIALTFLVFFMWEVFSAALLHPMQYAFTGFALCIFYLLLVSLSEHTGFDIAYAISSSSTTILIAGYARAVLKGTGRAVSVGAALVTLYAFLYLLLRLEDYALLAGSTGLFVVLALVMFITRRMNWYELKLGAES